MWTFVLYDSSMKTEQVDKFFEMVTEILPSIAVAEAEIKFRGDFVFFPPLSPPLPRFFSSSSSLLLSSSFTWPIGCLHPKEPGFVHAGSSCSA